MAKTFELSQVMAGMLIEAPSSVAYLTLDAQPGGQSVVIGAEGEKSRWILALGDTAPETGSNTGSNFQIARMADDGSTELGIPVLINRATGVTTLTNLSIAAPANLSIGGGSTGNVLSTNGAGVLSWSTAGAVAEAPTDGNVYGRSNATWTILPDLVDAPADGKLYGRENQNWMVIPPAGIGDAPPDGQMYGRQSNGWHVISGGGVGGTYLPLTGGILSGPLSMEALSGVARSIFGTQNSFHRWELQLGGAGPETGADAGSNFNLIAYDDTGAKLSTPISIQRSNGATTFGNTVTFSQPIAGNVHITGNITVDGSTTFGGAVTAPAFIASTTSDARVKQVLDEYLLGLEEISQLRPVAFRYLGNEASTEQGVSPHNEDASKRTVHIGLVAQDVEEIFPGMVSMHKGFIDGKEVNDLRKLDTRELIYALVNSVKTLKNEINQLRDELSEARRERKM